MEIREDEFRDFLKEYTANPQYEGKIKNPQTDRELRFEAAKWICLNDLYHFSRLVLGRDDLYKPYHKPMCDWALKHSDGNFLAIWPRGNFKSTLISIDLNIMKCLKKPSTQTLIANVVHDQAKKFLFEIKGIFETNKTLRALFHDIIPNQPKDAEKWTNESITLIRPKPEMSATFETCGMDSSTVGSHCDRLICDDIINFDTVRSADAMNKTIAWFEGTQYLLNPNTGSIWIAGTRYDFYDFYNYIIEKFVEPKGNFAFMERRALEGENVSRFVRNYMKKGNDQDEKDRSFVHKDDIWKDEPVFPTRWSKRKLKEWRARSGEPKFYHQMMNFPIDPAEQVFKRQYCKFWREISTQDWCYITVDPSVGATIGADKTAIVENYVDFYKKWRLKNFVYKRIGQKEIVEEIIRMYKNATVEPRAVGIETVGFQIGLKEAFEEECRKQGIYVNIVELKPHGRTKGSRIGALQYFYEHGYIEFSKEMRDILEEEVFRWHPGSKKDDFLDALAYMLDLIGDFGYPAVPDVLKESWREKYDRRVKELKGDYEEEASVNSLMNG